MSHNVFDRDYVEKLRKDCARYRKERDAERSQRDTDNEEWRRRFERLNERFARCIFLIDGRLSPAETEALMESVRGNQRLMYTTPDSDRSGEYAPDMLIHLVNMLMLGRAAR